MKKYSTFSELKNTDIIYSVFASIGNVEYMDSDKHEYKATCSIEPYYFKEIKDNMPISKYVLNVESVISNEYSITGVHLNNDLSDCSTTATDDKIETCWMNHEFFTTIDEAKEFVKKMFMKEKEKYQKRIDYINEEIKKLQDYNI